VNPSAATFLSQQSFGYCPRAKRSRSNTHAGVVGYLFETADNARAVLCRGYSIGTHTPERSCLGRGGGDPNIGVAYGTCTNF
jgi:hypothetical protein